MIQNWEKGKKEVEIERQNPRGEKRVENIGSSRKKVEKEGPSNEDSGEQGNEHLRQDG